ncbi:AAA family ATPase [Halocatena pleomorpha]|uniref:AAA family ATPase n=1 Tax=Halocatena pleomorpha TaxID=1785090 RepID=A0A3P3RAY3_9EURY|nr:AAA family ATPase [Halocatena pleomorpha]RRJ30545.1 AAA family ATPase [Halocatena pleomorpha]
MSANWSDRKVIRLGVGLVLCSVVVIIGQGIFDTLIDQFAVSTAAKSAVVAVISVLLLIIFYFYIIRTLWNDRLRKRAYELQERSTPEAGAEAISLLGRRDRRVRTVAAAVVANGCRVAPGKVVKQSSKDVETIVVRLVRRLTDSVHDVRANAAVSVKFFARDYPETVIEHADPIRNTLTASDSSVQTDAALAVGNLIAAFPDRADEFREPLSELCSDEDPEVRAAACVAFGYVPGANPADLNELSDDPSPLVTEAVAVAQAMSNGDPHAASQLFAGVATGRSTTQADLVEDSPDLDFDDVAGMESLKETLRRQIIEPFSGNDVYEKYGVAANSGVLFHGPPGTGKTHISKCLAGEIGCQYVSIDGGSIDQQRGDLMTQLFEDARRNQPCLVFIDEIDAIAADRSGIHQRPEDTKLVSQLLSELSTIGNEDDIVVIGATNDPDRMDDAMLRTGRFDSKIHVPPPDAEARVAIFDQHMDAPIDAIDLGQFKRKTEGFVASDMVEIARRASVKAATREQETGRESVVTESDLFDAIEEITSQQGMTGSYVQRSPDMDFSDVVGADELKARLRRTIIDPLTQPEFHEEYGLSVENGVLLHGPPGTGKTYVSQCLAGELDCSFISVKANDLVSKWIGEGAKNVGSMFEEARQNQPCLVFIDEIDALATDRSAHQSKSERQMVNQFLAELSQLNDDNEDVVVIGTTNKVDDIDSAMLRTGRFSELIEVPPPDADSRTALFDASLTAPTDGLSLDQIGAMTEGFVASDIEHAAELAARKAMRRAKTETGPEEVTQQDVIESINEIQASLDKR